MGRWTVAVVAAVVAVPTAAQIAAQTVTTYSADYHVEYRGRSAGSSRFTVSRDAGSDGYRFMSHSELEGFIARLVVPRPVVENSVFAIVDGQITPQSFRYEDGSRSGEDNYEISFDWPRAAQLAVGGTTREIALEPGMLDRGTAQVALAAAVAAGNPPNELSVIDDDGLEVYAVETLEPASTTTAAGEFETVRYAQQRAGSSRRTVFWLAPSLRYLPVRIEQIRNGEAETVFVLVKVTFDDD